LYAIGIRIVHSYSLHRIFVAKHKTSKRINFFTVSEWYHFLMCDYVLSTCRDDNC